MAKKSTFSLYMGKSNVTSFDELLTETAREKIGQGQGYKAESANFADGAALYVFPGQPRPPVWVEQLKPHFAFARKLFNQTHSAVLAFKKGKIFFAVAFSYGHVFLDNAKTEADFGLKVAINFVSDEKLRSVERSNIGAAIRDVAHAAGQKDLHAFGFDDALDLIRKVSGHAEESNFADKVTGARALSFTKEIEITEVPDVAADSIALFNSTAYKKTRFSILDFLSPVADVSVQAELDQKLVEAIRQGSDEFEIGLPEIVHNGIGSYRFENARMARFHPDLSLDLYREGRGDRLQQLSIDDLKSHHVAAYDADGSKPLARWSVHYALVGSIAMKGARYALNEGLWYRIDDKFKRAADDEFVKLCAPPDKKLRPFTKIYPDGGQKSGKPVYQSEASYNSEIASDVGYLHLDEKLIPIENTSGRGVEACDLIDLPGRRLIHVKKSSRQSSVLSHFFKQGSNAAQLLRKHGSFRTGLVEIVRKDYSNEVADELAASLTIEADKWTVEFQIADFPRADGTHNIPFFSKLSLRDEAQTIRMAGFDVKVAFISLTKIKVPAKPAKAA